MTLTPEVFARFAALGLAALGAYTDYKKGKIYNRHLLWGLGIGLVFLLIELLFWTLGWPSEARRFEEVFGGPLWYIGRVFLNTLVSFVVGFALWYLNLWAAGDAKLLTVMTFMIPLSTYSRNFWALYPAYPLLFNTFLVMLMLLVIEALYLMLANLIKSPSSVLRMKGILFWLKENFTEMWRMLVIFLLFFLVIKAIREYTREAIWSTLKITNNVIIYLLLFLLYPVLRRIMAHKWLRIIFIVLTLGSVIYVTLFPTREFNFITIIHMSAISIVVVIFRWIYNVYVKRFEVRVVPVERLKPGDILANETIRGLQKNRLEFFRSLGPLLPDGLTEEQVQKLKDWAAREGETHIMVRKTFPFAPSILLGLIVTWIFRGFPFLFY